MRQSPVREGLNLHLSVPNVTPPPRKNAREMHSRKDLTAICPRREIILGEYGTWMKNNCYQKVME